jgi:hypothetical protein
MLTRLPCDVQRANFADNLICFHCLPFAPAGAVADLVLVRLHDACFTTSDSRVSDCSGSERRRVSADPLVGFGGVRHFVDGASGAD